MSHDAAVLSRLIAHLRQAAAAYRRAGSDRPGLADVFEAAAGAHAHTAEVLEGEVHAAGGAILEAVEEADSSRHAWDALARSVLEGREALMRAITAAEAELLADVQAAGDDPATSEAVRLVLARASTQVTAARAEALRRLDALGGG